MSRALEIDPVDGLAFGRIGIGAVSLLSPRLAARLFLLDPDERQVPYLSRVFGARELALGLVTLSATGEDRRRLVALGMAVDAADAATGLIAIARGHAGVPAGALLTAAGVAGVAAGSRGLG